MRAVYEHNVGKDTDDVILSILEDDNDNPKVIFHFDKSNPEGLLSALEDDELHSYIKKFASAINDGRITVKIN